MKWYERRCYKVHSTTPFKCLKKHNELSRSKRLKKIIEEPIKKEGEQMIRLDLKEIKKQNSLTEENKFFAVKHVLNACAPASDEKREHIISLYVTEDKKQIVCTDGRRLHVSDNVYEWKSGFYEPIKNLKQLIILVKKEVDSELFPDFRADAEFPEIKDIIETKDCGSFDVRKFDNEIHNISSCYCKIAKQTEQVYNFKYIQDSIEYIDDAFEVYKKCHADQDDIDGKYNVSIVIKSFPDANIQQIAAVMVLKE